MRNTLESLPPLPEPRCPEGDLDSHTADQMRAYASAAVDAALHQLRNAKPAAWRYLPSPFFNIRAYTEDPKRAEEARAYGFEVEPVYTHPTLRALDEAEDRARFEAAMAREGYELNPARYRDGVYKDSYYESGWCMWRARAKEE